MVYSPIPTSCGGMSNETVRRSTFTNESVHGKIKKIPVDKNMEKERKNMYYYYYLILQSI